MYVMLGPVTERDMSPFQIFLVPQFSALHRIIENYLYIISIHTHTIHEFSIIHSRSIESSL